MTLGFEENPNWVFVPSTVPEEGDDIVIEPPPEETRIIEVQKLILVYIAG